MRIFVVVPWRRASKDSGVVRTGDFLEFQFSRRSFGTFGVEANIIMRRHEVPYWLFSDLKVP